MRSTDITDKASVAANFMLFCVGRLENSKLAIAGARAFYCGFKP